MNDLPQADATASMIRARLLLMTCLAISLDVERIVEIKNCNRRGSTGSTTSGLTMPATCPTLSQTASRASTALSVGSQERTFEECVNILQLMLWKSGTNTHHGVKNDAEFAAARHAAASSSATRDAIQTTFNLQAQCNTILPARSSALAKTRRKSCNNSARSVAFCH
jgi:hypothetical protein